MTTEVQIITKENIVLFNNLWSSISWQLRKELINRALNCWDNAPKKLKDLGDILTHGYITQDHTLKKIGSMNSVGDGFPLKEKQIIDDYRFEFGNRAYIEMIVKNRLGEILSESWRN